MDHKKLAKIGKRIEKLRERPANIRPKELIGIALSLDRYECNRGKEPTYVAGDDRLPLSIPNHPGTLKSTTAKSILRQLSDDVEYLKEYGPHG